MILMDYIEDLFTNVLDANRAPKVMRYIWKTFDDIAKDNNIEPQVAQGWKNNW